MVSFCYCWWIIRIQATDVYVISVFILRAIVISFKGGCICVQFKRGCLLHEVVIGRRILKADSLNMSVTSTFSQTPSRNDSTSTKSRVHISRRYFPVSIR